jgi:choloylglycine hydrolase
MCEDFLVEAEDGTRVVSRTMQLAWDINFHIRTRPREHKFKSPAINGQEAHSFTGKHGYLYIDSGKAFDYCNDGMNEHGLCFEYLNLKLLDNIPEKVLPGQESRALPVFMLGDYILSQFATCQEFVARNECADRIMFTREGLSPECAFVCQPYHAALHDRTGASLALEFIEGRLHVFANPGTVLTNAPGYEWQLEQLALREFSREAPSRPQYFRAGAGLPGDTSPAHRFLKLTHLLKSAPKPKTSLDAICLAEHLTNLFDIAKGWNRTYDVKDTSQLLVNYSMWHCYKDMTNLRLYFKTYEDMALRKVEMGRLSLEAGAAPLAMPLRSYRHSCLAPDL